MYSVHWEPETLKMEEDNFSNNTSNEHETQQ